MRTTPEITLVIPLSGDGPLPVRLAGGLRHLIGVGALRAGDPVPSSRALAAHLGISRGSVITAFDQLLAEGFLSASPGAATIVNPQLRRVQPRQPSPAEIPEPPRPELLDLRPGQPWTDGVVGPAWKAAWRQASIEPVNAKVPAIGLPVLRAEWSDHLRRMRAVVRDPAQIVVTAGGREGLALVLRTLARTNPGPGWLRVPEKLRVGVEEPGYPSLRRVLTHFGCEIIALPTDSRGLQVGQLPVGMAAPDVILVTPSHQYPLGGSLPMERRQALLEWARGNQVLVVEDDYDSELRYTSHPLPALASLDDPADPRVVMLATLSKTLTPALAMGFLAVPDWWLPQVTATRAELGQPVGLVPQRALAHYLASGALRLHTQRMRQRYRRRRAQVVERLSGVPGLVVYPMDGGLHAVAEIERPESEVVAELKAVGIQVSALSQYWSGIEARQGIVFGFGAVSDGELERSLNLIAAIASGSAG